MNNIFSSIKNFIWFIFTAVAGVFASMAVMLYLLFFVFTLHCLIGWWTSEETRGERFSVKRMSAGLEQFVLLLGVIIVARLAVQAGGYREAADSVMNWGCLYVVYMYTVKMIKNSRRLFPNSAALAILDNVLSVEVLKFLTKRFGVSEEAIKKTRDELNRHRDGKDEKT